MEPTTPLLSNKDKIKQNALDSANQEMLLELLKGVIAFIDVRVDNEDCSDCVGKQMIKFGAVVVKRFLPKVTHLVFFGGYRRSYNTALRRKIHIVLPHWISDSEAKMCKQDEDKYIPDIPPKKEKVSFFRTLKFRQMVEQIMLGIYVPMDKRGPDYVDRPLTVSERRKLKLRYWTRTPKTGRGTRRPVKRSRKKVVPEPEQDQNSGSSEEDEVFKFIRSTFKEVDRGQPIGRLILDGVKAMREKNINDRYSIWADPPATVTKCEEDEDAYVPLFERCRAKLLAENILIPPSYYNSISGHANTSELQNRPDTHTSSESDDLIFVSELKPPQSGINASEEILHQEKRRGSPEASSCKKARLDQTLELDEPLETPTVGTPGQVLPKRCKNKMRLYHDLRPTIPKNRRDPRRASLASSMTANKNLGGANNLNTDNCKQNNDFPHSLRTSMPNQILNRTSLSSDTTTPSHKISKNKLKTPSQPSRRSARLSMRVQNSLDISHIPKDASESLKPDSLSNAGLLNPLEVDNKNPISDTFHDKSQEDNTSHLPTNGTPAAANLHKC